MSKPCFEEVLPDRRAGCYEMFKYTSYTREIRKVYTFISKSSISARCGILCSFVRQIVKCISDSSGVFLEADQNLKQLADCSTTKRKIGNKPIKSVFRRDLNV